MRSSPKVTSTGQCPRCRSYDVVKRDFTYPGIGVLVQTRCATCGFWVGNCSFDNGKGTIEHRGFLAEGAVPPDLPAPIRAEVERWRLSRNPR